MPRPKGEIFLWVNRAWCKRCGICIELCPRKVFDVDGDGYPVLARMDDCIDCGICYTQCPDYAIFDDEQQKERFLGAHKQVAASGN